MALASELFLAATRHHQAGRLREAELAYRQVLQREPAHADAIHYLGVLAKQVGQTDAALKLMGRSIQLNPNNPAFHINLAIILQELGQFEQARAHCRRAIELQPGYAEGHANLGAVFCSAGDPAAGIAPLRRALELEPGNLKARYNLAEALARIGEPQGAIEEYERVLAADPGHAKARFGLSLLRLRAGDFERGWDDYEARWQIDDPSVLRRQFTTPLWDGGGELSGKTILLYGEQGYGDAIHFVRYIPLVHERGGRVILECLPGLTRLFEGMVGVERLTRYGDPPPPHDVRCPLMSLPRVFRTTLQTIPATVPYLFAPQALIDRWGQKLSTDGVPRGNLKVGLCWSGNPRQLNNAARSIPVEMLAPLAAVPGVAFYSLQKFEEPPGQPSLVPAALALRDHTADLTDFAQTAALIANLDLAITVDTSIAHLAGALGKPVWTMLAFVADWRYLMARADNPWYPTMRLFRQSSAGDWPGVVDRVAADLRKRAAAD